VEEKKKEERRGVKDSRRGGRSKGKKTGEKLVRE
jgi:hypothetical protein